jgi:type IV pilus assembly protein PilB
MTDTLKDRVIKTLIKTKQLKEEDINEAIALQKKRGIALDKALIEKGLIHELDLLMLLVKELNVPFINLSKYKIDASLREVIPERIARLYNIIPLANLESTITVATADPLNVFAIDDLKSITGKEIDVVMSTSSGIAKAIDSYYGTQAVISVTEVSKDIHVEDFEIVSDSQGREDSDSTVDESEKAPIIRLVNLIIQEAIRQRSSDIHIEPLVDELRVRYRVDGVLHNVLTVPKDNQNSVLVRIKILSQLDITVRNVPQDGRFKLKVFNKVVDFRVSLLPTTFGEKVVMRILDKGNLSIGLSGLGISMKNLEQLNDAIRKPFGMILVTGPTGSGKSTTLYSIISELNTVDRNIITVEDPVEYLIEGLTQIHARPDIGLTFAEGLRSILRQSPDIVMVGEIRDNETADIAIKASLTGQLVLSTLHTNDAAGALTRLIDMGVEPFLVASSIVLVSAQRLCRKVCSKCKEPITIAPDVLVALKANFQIKPGTVFYQGKGCEFCRRTGYMGRLCITEVLEIDDDIRNLLLNGKSSDDIKEFARQKKGMLTLWEDAMQKCVDGITTLEEVMRITASE